MNGNDPVRRAAALVERLLGLGLALLLLRSAFAHLGNPYYFLSSIYSYQIVGIQMGQWIAGLMPFVQLALAVALLLQTWNRQAYALSSILFLSFVMAQGSALRRGLDIPCGCHGASDSLRIGRSSLAITSAALVASVVGFACATRAERNRGPA